MDTQDYDIIIIGAGQSGIVCARFYLDVHPNCRLVLVEKESVVGGTWSKERVFPGFMSQASYRIAGFSDVPFQPPLDRIDGNAFFEAGTMSDYLEDYVDKHIYNGESLRDRVLYHTSVDKFEKIDSTWHVHCTKVNGNTTTPITLKAPKIIVASGATSKANIPKIKGVELFKGKIIHSIDWGSASFLQNQNLKRVAILGGGKSAADMVYQCVKAGKQVSWIIRKSGKGPGAFVPGAAMGWFKNPSELGVSRLGTLFILSGLGGKGWWYYFLFNTKIGQWLYTKIGEMGGKQAGQEANFHGRSNARESYKMLDPKVDVQWLWHPAGIMNHADWYDSIAEHVDVYREDIEYIDATSLHLHDGHVLEADLVLLATGFIRVPNPFSEAQAVELGLPHDKRSETPSEAARWKDLDDTAVKRIVEKYPVLASHPIPPGLGDVLENYVPFRLYNNTVPVNDSSILFVGFAVINNMWYASEIQSIYATAILDGRVMLPTREKMEEQIAYVNAYMKMRIPTYGREGNYWVFDMFPFFERLLGEVGLQSWKRSWWRETFHPLMPSDLKDLKAEYLNK